MTESSSAGLWTDLLEPALLAHGGQRVSSVERRTLFERSYAAVFDDVADISSRLTAAGVGPGQPVGIIGPNCLAWIASDLALLKIGAHPVGLPVDGGKTSADHLRDAGLRAVISVSPVTDDLPDDAALVAGGSWSLHLAERWQPLPTGTLAVAFSSGTTGRSKGVLLTSAGIHRAIDVTRSVWQVGDDDAILVVLPFSSFQQRLLCYVAMCSGAAIHLVPPHRMYQMMARLEPTIVLGPPSFFDLLTKVASWRSVYGRRARLLLTGSAPVPRSLLEAAEAGDVPLFEVYGSTEFGWISMNLPGRSRTGSSGRLVAGVALRRGSEGQIQVSSPANQAVGYIWAGEEPTPDVFVDGRWIDTGDVGSLDGDGYVHLSGRKKNVLITRSGVKFAPEPIEQLVLEHPAAVAAMVFMSTDHNHVQIAIWTGDPKSAQREHLRRHCASINAGLAEYSRIRDVDVRDARELTPESGLLTGNYKLNRRAASALLSRADGEPAHGESVAISHD